MHMTRLQRHYPKNAHLILPDKGSNIKWWACGQKIRQLYSSPAAPYSTAQTANIASDATLLSLVVENFSNPRERKIASSFLRRTCLQESILSTGREARDKKLSGIRIYSSTIFKFSPPPAHQTVYVLKMKWKVIPYGKTDLYEKASSSSTPSVYCPPFFFRWGKMAEK